MTVEVGGMIVISSDTGTDFDIDDDLRCDFNRNDELNQLTETRSQAVARIADHASQHLWGHVTSSVT